MISGNGLPAASECDEGVRQGRDESQPLRHIQNLIAKLEVVNRQLSFPLRGKPVHWPEDAGLAENPET